MDASTGKEENDDAMSGLTGGMQMRFILIISLISSF